MGETSYGNAMTEVALALAMGFFSIMVLAMVSMGTPQSEQVDVGTDTSVKMTLTSPSPNDVSTDKDLLSSMDQIIVFWQGRYFDRDLKPLNVDKHRFKGRIVLAVSPDLPMSQALEVQSHLPVKNVVVSTLDPRWLETLSNVISKE